MCDPFDEAIRAAGRMSDLRRLHDLLDDAMGLIGLLKGQGIEVSIAEAAGADGRLGIAVRASMRFDVPAPVAIMWPPETPGDDGKAA